MGTDITAATVVRDSVVVEAPIGVAFDVFTTNFGAWFPREYNLMADPIAERTFEPRAGGEIVDRSESGDECRWSDVLAYEPPTRVVFTWKISPMWTIESDRHKVSEVEVRFVPESDERTRVELEHRHLDRHGEGWQQLRDAVAGGGGWTGCLQAYAAAVPAR
jgi:uncharacterized protein YndB with AHSA1/START domain